MLGCVVVEAVDGAVENERSDRRYAAPFTRSDDMEDSAAFEVSAILKFFQNNITNNKLQDLLISEYYKKIVQESPYKSIRRTEARRLQKKDSIPLCVLATTKTK